MKFVLLLACCLVGALSTPVEDPVLKEFSTGNVKFTSDLYKQMLVAGNDGNFLVSPLSIEVVMALTGSGAKGVTADQIRSGLSLPSTQEKIDSTFKALIPSLKGNEHYSLSSANNIYVKNDLKVLDSFKQAAVNVFDAGIENVDFSKSVETAKYINDWVEGKTNNKIHDLITSSDLDSYTLMILINALHFKGLWEKKFDVTDTTKKPFYTSEKDSVDVDTMHTTDSFNYYESPELDAKFLEMPYKGGDLSMTIVLPNKKTGLAALEGRLLDVFKTPTNYKKERVQVQLPKFQIESNIQLKPIMEKMGITTPFTNDADFSGITGSKGLRISKVIQKTFIKVAEEGTEAAAATAVLVHLSSGHVHGTEPKSFIADRPFAYLIKNKDVVLFAGRLTVPKA